jgi:hypothetical protein
MIFKNNVQTQTFRLYIEEVLCEMTETRTGKSLRNLVDLDALGESVDIVPFPISKSRLVRTSRSVCPDCGGTPGKYVFCSKCAEERIRSHVQILFQTEGKIWIDSPFVGIYFFGTPGLWLQRCIWKGRTLNQEPRCHTCGRQTAWSDLESVQKENCKCQATVCIYCAFFDFRCLCQRLPLSEMLKSLILVDETEFVPFGVIMIPAIPLESTSSEGTEDEPNASMLELESVHIDGK